MDSGDYEKLLERFVRMVDKPNLKSEFPEQYQKHWENKGRSGIVQIIQASIINELCDVKFSLFFDKEEVIQTGILIKFQREPVINEVRKGDVLNYKNRQRVDIVAFLKDNFGSVSSDGLRQEYTSESFALAIDEDSEPEVFRAVEQLTGRSEQDLRHQWEELVATNPQRSGMAQVSPIIRVWLKKVRDRLDMQYLLAARILHPREQEVTQFVSQDRFFTITTKQLTGDEIRAKIDSTDPEWWGGAFYAYVNTLFSRVPHDPRDRLAFLDAFDPGAPFSCEEIFVDNRHIYTVVYMGEEDREALVWRTRNQVTAEALGIFHPPAEPRERSRARQIMDKLAGKEEPAEAAVDVEESALPAAHPYRVLQAEKAYVLALPKSPTLNDRRREYLTLLYDSDPSKYRGNIDQMLGEIDGLLLKVFKKKPAGLERERRLLQAHAVIFYDEREDG